MEKAQQLAIAKMVYKDIMSMISRWEMHYCLGVHAHWDECITVDGELFHGHQLRDDDER
jgi:hypothetical protein